MKAGPHGGKGSMTKAEKDDLQGKTKNNLVVQILTLVVFFWGCTDCLAERSSLFPPYILIAIYVAAALLAASFVVPTITAAQITMGIGLAGRAVLLIYLLLDIMGERTFSNEGTFAAEIFISVLIIAIFAVSLLLLILLPLYRWKDLKSKIGFSTAKIALRVYRIFACIMILAIVYAYVEAGSSASLWDTVVTSITGFLRPWAFLWAYPRVLKLPFPLTANKQKMKTNDNIPEQQTLASSSVVKEVSAVACDSGATASQMNVAEQPSAVPSEVERASSAACASGATAGQPETAGQGAGASPAAGDVSAANTAASQAASAQTKFCTHCGKQILKEAVICPYCGCAVDNAPKVNDQSNTGLNIISFLFPVIGLILYLVYHEKEPIKARALGKWALYGVGLAVICYILLVACSASILL